MSEQHKKVCRILYYFEHFLIFVSTVYGCVSTSAFTSLVGVAVGILISPEGLNICAIIAEIRNYESIIKKTEKTQ